MNEGTAFVHKFLPAYGAILGCTLPIAVVAGVLDFGAAHPWKTVALSMFTAALAAALTLGWTRMRVTLFPDGLKCYDLSGSYRFARWQEMAWARPTRMILGLPYLRVGADDGRGPMWLPLFLVDVPRFAVLVSAHAGPGHPVAVALSRRAGAQPQHAAAGASHRR